MSVSEHVIKGGAESLQLHEAMALVDVRHIVFLNFGLPTAFIDTRRFGTSHANFLACGPTLHNAGRSKGLPRSLDVHASKMAPDAHTPKAGKGART